MYKSTPAAVNFYIDWKEKWVNAKTVRRSKFQETKKAISPNLALSWSNLATPELEHTRLISIRSRGVMLSLYVSVTKLFKRGQIAMCDVTQSYWIKICIWLHFSIDVLKLCKTRVFGNVIVTRYCLWKYVQNMWAKFIYFSFFNIIDFYFRSTNVLLI